MISKHTPLLNTRFVISVLILLTCVRVSSAATNIYMKYDGDDNNNGNTTNTPVKTLNRVKEIAATITLDDIDVQIYPGTYNNDSVNWDNPIVAGQVITFRQWAGQSGWPTFVGPGIGGTASYNTAFFTLGDVASNGAATNIRFWHLKIQEYKDGIILDGLINDRSKWNSNNEIVDVRFYRIGDKWAGNGEPGYKCLGFVNSKNNYVRYNRFEHCENNPPDENQNLIHGIYLAHWSKNNDIRYNFFSYNSGDPIKTRDHSGGNTIAGNAFWRSGNKAATVGDWYANPEMVNSQRTQTKWVQHGQRWECPSFANNVRYNDYGKDYTGTSLLPQVAKSRPEDFPNYTGGKFATKNGECPGGCDVAWECPGDCDVADECPTSGSRFSTASNDYTANWSTILGIISSWEDVNPNGLLSAWRANNNIN